MKSITLWRVGLVRCIALLIAAGALHGLQRGISHGFRWNIEAMSMPTATALLLCAIGLYILGFRTERDYEKISRLSTSSQGHIYSTDTSGNDDPDRDG
jgi:hypothetical protein